MRRHRFRALSYRETGIRDPMGPKCLGIAMRSAPNHGAKSSRSNDSIWSDSALGLVSTKIAALEDRDAIMRRVDAAAEFMNRDRLCLSPQCGFASLDSGNGLSADHQAAKIRLVVDIAREIWGYEPAGRP